jgi:hypothetical protein
MNPPVGIDAIRAAFGDIQVANGQVIAPSGWESNNMIIVSDLPLIGRRLYVNKNIADPLRAALAACEALGDGYVLRTIGCFAPRPKRVNGDLSIHSWGAAVDINSDTNPLTPVGGIMVCDIPTAWIAAFKDQGFTWGGEFSGRKDPMHFQFCSGY